MGLVTIGEKVHVVERRMFPDDIRGHFLGEVVGVSETAMRLTGYVFVYDGSANEYVRRDTRRDRLVSLAATGLLINFLPPGADIDAARYWLNDEGHLIVTDEESFSLDINEFGFRR